MLHENGQEIVQETVHRNNLTPPDTRPDVPYVVRTEASKTRENRDGVPIIVIHIFKFMSNGEIRHEQDVQQI